MLEQLGLTGDENCAHLSGGEARRASLARVLAPDPDILLLDEPTNHLDITTIEWLERELEARRSAIVMISHDRRFLVNLSRATVWLDRGQTRRLERGFAAFRGMARHRAAKPRSATSTSSSARSPPRSTGSATASPRGASATCAASASSGAARTAARSPPRRSTVSRITAGEAEQSGALVIEAKNISKATASAPSCGTYSTIIERGDRIGIVGPNGSGKTTLISC